MSMNFKVLVYTSMESQNHQPVLAGLHRIRKSPLVLNLPPENYRATAQFHQIRLFLELSLLNKSKIILNFYKN